ncbi:TonB-dependent receptor [Orbus sturtevantii]|uniref:TonB-dependent receptor plug domain-containing protein n=1 Tax=Orbus sturtevantii TaxID=3074109 RepID=UPI00370D8401
MRKKLTKTCLVSSLTFALINIAYAGTTTNKIEPNKQETIIVTAARSEQSIWDSSVSVSAINSEDIQKNNGDSIVETLRDIPGVEISDNSLAGRKQIIIRGESSSRVLILIDGQEVSYHRSGHGSGAGILIDMESVERVELIKGPYSVLYGSQAIGGVVNFITRKGSDNNLPFNGHVKFIYDGATNGRTEMGSLYGTVDNIFNYRISGTYSEQGARKTPEGRLEHTNFDNDSISSWFGLNLDKHKIGLSLDRYKLNTESYASKADLKDMNDFLVSIPKLQREKAGLFYDYEIDGSLIKNLHIDGYYQTLKRTFINRIDMSGPDMFTNTQTNDKQKTTGINLQVDLIPTEQIKLILGAQYLIDSVDQISNKQLDMYYKPSVASPLPLFDYTKLTAGSNSWQQKHFSLFAQNDWKITDNWNWNIGLRQYWVRSELKNGEQNVSCINRPSTAPCAPSSTIDKPSKDSDDTLVASTGATYSGFDDIILRASFAQGYVYPTLTHLYAVTNAHTQEIYGNPNLKAEKSNNIEIGMRFNQSDWLVDSALYYAAAKNYIDQMECNGAAICNGLSNNGSTTRTYYYNANKAKTYGLEFSIDYLGWDITPYLRGNILRRQLQTNTYKTFDSGNPTFSGSFGVKHTAYFNHLDLDSDLFMRVATDATKKSDTETYYYGGWSTLNLSMVVSFGLQRQYQLGLDLNNILNKKYTTVYETVPAAKFNAVIAASIKF